MPAQLESTEIAAAMLQTNREMIFSVLEANAKECEAREERYRKAREQEETERREKENTDK